VKTKACTKCKIEKPTTEFHNRGKYLHSYCKPCHVEDNRFRKYNITVEDYHRKYYEQRGKCIICKSYAELVVDHAHKCGTVRGLICNNCNTGLGLFKDNTEVLSSAIEYLGGTNGDNDN
jgi:hypothetical protein